MNKYQRGEIQSLQEYKDELWEKENKKAHCSVLSYHAFFERAVHEVDARMESTLKVADPVKLCEQYIA